MGYRRSAADRRPGFFVEPLETRRLLAAGGPDPSFGNGGKVTADFGVPGDVGARDIAVQADGKTVVVAELSAGKFAVARFNVDGTPDLTFGPGHTGQVVTAFPALAHSRALALQDDGKIVVVGEARRGNDQFFPNYLYSFAVARYNPDGSLDRSFDGDGLKTFNFGEDERGSTASAVAVQLDGKIVIGGTVEYLFQSGQEFGTDRDFAFARLNPDGSFDTSFDRDGRTDMGFGDLERLSDLALDYSGTPATNPNYGKIVAVGTTANSAGSLTYAAVGRLNADGTQDFSFSRDGGEVIDFLRVATAVVIQPTGKIVVAGTYLGDGQAEHADYALARLLPGGDLDAGFGPDGSGFVSVSSTGPGSGTGADFPTDLISPYDGGLIMSGTVTFHGPYNEVYGFTQFYAFTADGRLDTARFGPDGHVGVADWGEVRGRLAYGPGKRFVYAGGPGFKVGRFLDAGANLVYAATLNSVASENGPTARGFFVYRQERLPYATRVYFDIGGTATAPSPLTFRSRDYTVDGMVIPDNVFGDGGPPYVDIHANETFAVVTITPVDDTRAEGNETAVFSIRADPSSATAYEVGTPGTASFVITDNDAPPPSVQQVHVRGSSWKGADGDETGLTFGEYLAANGLGDARYGYRVDGLPAGSTLPWANANQLVLRYDYPPTGAAVPTPGGVTLHGARSDYAVVAVDMPDPADRRVFVLMLDRPLGALPAAQGGGSDGDVVTLSVPGGAAGAGPYTLTLNPLPGDADRSGGRVSAIDLASAKTRVNRTATEPPPAAGAAYNPFADVNADGRINSIDLGAVKARLNDSLPAASGATVAPFDDRDRPGSILSLPEFLLA